MKKFRCSYIALQPFMQEALLVQISMRSFVTARFPPFRYLALSCSHR